MIQKKQQAMESPAATPQPRPQDQTPAASEVKTLDFAPPPRPLSHIVIKSN